MSPMISAVRIVSWFAMELGTSLVHPHCTPIEYLTIQRNYGGVGFGCLRHFDKSDTARLARVPVHDDSDGFDGAMCCKSFAQLLLCYRDVKVPEKDVGHEF